MSRLTIDSLARYDGKLKSWLGKNLAPQGSTAPMAMTEKAGAVAFWPVGGTPLLPAVDFLFAETPPASGDKGPENPSTITGVSEVKVSTKGSNLFCIPPQTTTMAGVDVTIGEDGTITFDGTSTYTAGNNFGIRVDFPVNVKCSPGMTVKVSFIPVSGSATSVMSDRPYNAGLQQSIFKSDGSVLRYVNCTDATQNYTYTIPENIYDSYIGPRQYLYIDKGASFDNYKFKINVELLTDVGWDVPAAWNNHTIELGNTYYGGTLDVATGVMTVTWDAVALDGSSETWFKNSNSTDEVSVFHCNITLPHLMSNNLSASTRICSHFSYGTSVVANIFSTWGTFSRIFLHLPAASYPDKTSLAAWLASEYSAGHPVVVGYMVNEPYTVQLAPLQLIALTQPDKYTPRVNTLYSDAESIQVGYLKSPIRDEFEKTQAIIAQGGGV